MKFKSGTWRIAAIVIVLVLVCIGVYFALPYIWRLFKGIISLFLPFILGYIFSLLVRPLADHFQKRLKLPRGLAAILVIVVIIGVIGGGLSFAVWKVIVEVRNVSDQLPQIVDSIGQSIENVRISLSGVFQRLPGNIQVAIQSVSQSISDWVAELINTKSTPMVLKAGDFAKALPGVFIGIVVFILSSYFMVSNPRPVSNFISRVFSARFLEKTHKLAEEIKLYLGGYIRAQGILMCIAFVIIMLGLTILGVDYALLIALAIAFLDALPFFGSGAVLWPWALISFINGNIKTGVGLVLIYICVAVVRQLVEPKIVSSKLGTNPLLTLMSMYIGYRLLSVGGMILGPIIMLLVMSLYKAGVFDGLIELLHKIRDFLKKQLNVLKQYLQTIGGKNE